MKLYIYLGLHFIGAFMTILSLGAVLMHRLSHAEGGHPHRRLLAATHGGGLFLVLLGGFGAAAVMKHPASSPWLLLKIGIFLLLGAALPALQRGWLSPKAALFLLPLLAALAAFLGKWHGVPFLN